MPRIISPIFITLIIIILSFSSHALSATEPLGEEMTFNFREVDIRTVIQSVSKITGKNFIIDPSIKDKVTIVSSNPLSPSQVYEVFLSILQVHNYSAVELDNITKIIPHERAKHNGSGQEEIDGPSPPGDSYITRIHHLDHTPVGKLVPILRPLMNPKSYLAAHIDSNSIIITDNSSNITRLLKIIHLIDQGKTTTTEIIRLHHADARDIVRVIEGVDPKAKKGDDPTAYVRIISDERTNSIVLSGAERHIRSLKELIEHLDSPIKEEGSTQVVFLRYAIAKEMVPILSGIEQEKTTQRPSAAKKRELSDEIKIQADEATNALVITAPPSVMKSLLSVIRKLDIRRGQVMIEAIVAEVSIGKSADLGIQFRSTSNTDGSGLIGGTDFSSNQRPGGSINSTSLNPLGALSSGFNLGYFNDTTTILGAEILNLGSLISALNSDTDTNVLSTPTLMTLDNEEAEISVGENVPFATGSYTSTNNNPDNPFTTYDRKDVGVKLKIKPQINEGNTIRLELSQEVSKMIPSSAAPGLQSTDTRSIKTTVIVEDGKIIVLGGLISDDVQETVLKVPILGDIPFLGAMFRYSYTSHQKKNLMVFIHPVIIRDASTSSRIAFDKYDYMRRKQLEFNEPGINLMPAAEPPLLPVIEQDRILLQSQQKDKQTSGH